MKATVYLITITIFFFQSINAQNLYPDLFDSSNGISNGYGSWGANNYIREASIDVANKGVITFYHPDTAPQQSPTIFFISGWGQTYETYDKFFKYIASLGYPVVNIYNLNPGSINTSYPNSVSMIQEAVTTYSDWIDTSKVGLMGHSYGAGSCIWIGNQLFDPDDLNWGTNGRFIMMFAPWYPFLIEANELQSYQNDVKLLVLQSFDDFYSGGSPTYNTDPRIIRAMYELINIPDSEKDFITVFSDNDSSHEYSYNGNTYSYEANHYISYTDIVEGDNNPYDRLDVFAMNRLTNAMTAYVFEGDNAAKDVVLGNGSTVQKDMDIMPDLAVTDYYVTTRPESDFEYKCTADANAWPDPAIWKLYDYCIDSDNDGVIDNLSYKDYQKNTFSLYPNPSNNIITIQLKNRTQIIRQIEILDFLGRLLYKVNNPSTNQIRVSKLSKGSYLLKVHTDKSTGIEKFIVN